MTVLDDSSSDRALGDGCSIFIFVEKSFAVFCAQVNGILVDAQELVRLMKQGGILECYLWKLAWRLSWPLLLYISFILSVLIFLHILLLVVSKSYFSTGSQLLPMVRR